MIKTDMTLKKDLQSKLASTTKEECLEVLLEVWQQAESMVEEATGVRSDSEPMGFDEAELDTLGYVIETLRKSGYESTAALMEDRFGKFEKYNVLVTYSDWSVETPAPAKGIIDTNVYVPVQEGGGRRVLEKGVAIDTADPKREERDGLSVGFIAAGAAKVIFDLYRNSVWLNSETVTKDSEIIYQKGAHTIRENTEQ